MDEQRNVAGRAFPDGEISGRNRVISGVPLLDHSVSWRKSMTQIEQDAKPLPVRPVSITILAWFLIVGGALFLLMKPLTWSEFTIERNLWSIFSKGTSLVCGIGLLGMRRWAVALYFGLFVLNCVLIFTWPPNEAVLEQYSRPGPIAMMMIVPAIVAAITLPRWNAMRW